MSTTIHGFIDYRLRGLSFYMGFGTVRPGVSYSNIFGLLGAKGHNEAKTRVPVRGLPSRNPHSMGSDVTKMLYLGTKETYERDDGPDGVTIPFDEAVALVQSGKSTFVEDDSYFDEDGNLASWVASVYVTDPDIHSLNWVTADELEFVVKIAEQDGGGFLAGYRAIVAAMRALEADAQVEDVRFIYGFDN